MLTLPTIPVKPETSVGVTSPDGVGAGSVDGEAVAVASVPGGAVGEGVAAGGAGPDEQAAASKTAAVMMGANPSLAKTSPAGRKLPAYQRSALPGPRAQTSHTSSVRLS